MPLDEFESREELLRRLQEPVPRQKRGSLPRRIAQLEKQVALLCEQVALCSARLAQLFAAVQIEAFHAPQQDELGQLTRREREILIAFAKDRRLSLVAKRLRRNYHTVRNQLLAAQQKLGLPSREALIRWIDERQKIRKNIEEEN
jgi:DNA-binding CsgD family transcriptional regulator